MSFEGLFDKLNESHIMYHGTNHEFTEFEKRKGQVSTVFGTEEVDREGFWFSPTKELAATYGDNIVTAKLHIDNTADLTDSGWDSSIDRAWEDIGMNPRWFGSVEAWELFDGDDGKMFVKFLQNMGFDSAAITEPAVAGHKAGEVFVVFDPKDIEIVEVTNE